MTERFTQFMDQAGNQYDLVLIDTPPALAVTDAAIVGMQAGTSLMVVRFQASSLKEIERAAEVCRRAVPDIGSIPHVDTRVPADRPVQLTVTDIDGANARGSVLEQTIGESSGRCTRIETAFTRRVDCESVQRCFELQTTP